MQQFILIHLNTSRIEPLFFTFFPLGLTQSVKMQNARPLINDACVYIQWHEDSNLVWCRVWELIVNSEEASKITSHQSIDEQIKWPVKWFRINVPEVHQEKILPTRLELRKMTKIEIIFSSSINKINEQERSGGLKRRQHWIEYVFLFKLFIVYLILT